ncbi:MAG TPA: DUF58 domain-containing protein [Holophaga sp.]|nr:DUF58 domain-containing protein [Holophaga sp.]HPS68220.1 DUF58 domain-containing protein [Holophaga sp.]
MNLIDPECASLVRTFQRRTQRRPPAEASAARDPMFRRAGASFDLKSIREYQPSDDPRRIDWKLMGRTDRLFVKDYYAEERDGVCLLVDLSGSMGIFGAEETLVISASVAWMLGALGLPTSLWAFSEGIERRLDRPRGGASPAPVLAFFAGLEIGGRTALASALAILRKATRHRRVVVVSDFLDPAFRASACPFARCFFIRLHRGFETLETGTSEIEVIDPETGLWLRMPWDRLARTSYHRREGELDGSFLQNKNHWYRKIVPGTDRVALYWALLEALHA